MSVRQALPGEHLSPQCGHHCGVRSTADGGEAARTFIGHCSCPDCICLFADYPGHVSIPAVEFITDQAGTGRRVPMCESWGTM